MNTTIQNGTTTYTADEVQKIVNRLTDMGYTQAELTRMIDFSAGSIYYWCQAGANTRSAVNAIRKLVALADSHDEVEIPEPQTKTTTYAPHAITVNLSSAVEGLEEAMSYLRDVVNELREATKRFDDLKALI